ncbi:MAG TPA: hypothetical protein VFB68_01950 [Xanthobacteraceae bacterium]|nr:hypothetical protein [Xanthobacteraceae bacterium]
MGYPPRLRLTRSAIRGLLILLCLFAIPKLAFSEADTSTDLNTFVNKRPKVIHHGVSNPEGTSWRLYLANGDCTAAKLDIWLQNGAASYSASLPDGGLNFRSAVGARGITTMLIGGKDCLIRVRIEPVPAGTNISE